MNYTDDEIIDALQDIGYMTPEDGTLHQIRDKLNSSSYLDDISIIEMLANISNSSQTQDLRKNDCPIPEKYSSLFADAERVTKVVQNQLEDLDYALEEMLAGLPNNVVKNLRQELAEVNRSPSPPPEPVQKSIPMESRPKLKNFEFDDENQPLPLDDRVEQELINEVCRQRGLKRVHCPPPGRAPFKHDPVARNQQYQEVWKQFPVPGEKRRKALRWKIRELMFRRDIPRLKVIPNPRCEPKAGLKPWDV